MKKLELIGKTQMPTNMDRPDEGVHIENFCTEQAKRFDAFWDPLFCQIFFGDLLFEGDEPPSEDDLSECRDIVKKDVLELLKDGANLFSKGECPLPFRFRSNKTLFEAIMFIIAFDPAFEYLLEDDEDSDDDEKTKRYLDTDRDVLYDVNNFKIDVTNALDAYILNGAALARNVGSASYAIWTKAMIALSDLMNGVAEAEEADNTARVAVESVIEAQRQLWADIRCMRKCEVDVKLDVKLDSKTKQAISAKKQKNVGSKA